MDQKTTGIVATVAAALLCGCPGLFGLCFGAIAAIVSFIPDANIDIMGSNDPQSALVTGLGGVCVGIVFIAIPVVVGFVTLRKKPAELPASDEPLPPPA